jgi:uncharacterized protein YbbC (DUF1343 family)
MNVVETGCDVLVRECCRSLAGRRIGLLVNPASVTAALRPTPDALLACGAGIDRLFGPQHGLHGDTQANMIEWEGFSPPRLGLPVPSLYGERREPSPEMLAGLDEVVIDLPDVGARPYTYLWTAFLALRSCARAGIPVSVLDRPNPIGGDTVEGAILDMNYRSFVGLAPIPMRHGLTFGEALGLMNAAEARPCDLRVVRMNGWRRAMRFADTGLPWVLPSPNMPAPDTALVYPGTVMLEGTNISEGRGTTRPFEIVGAPWLEPDAFAREIERFAIPGVSCRPLHFTPAWDKYAGERCGGVQIHVVDERRFAPVRCGAAGIAAARRLRPDAFAWSKPPYEYELRLPPIDVISGGAALREAIDAGGDLGGLFDSWERDEARFLSERGVHLLYE